MSEVGGEGGEVGSGVGGGGILLNPCLIN